MAKGKWAAEWIGAIVSMPGFVTNEHENYRPEILLWMTSAGAIVGHSMGKPGEMLGAASADLQRTIASPMFGPPHTPTRIRIASAELAAAIRAGHPDLEVVCAPTPEIDPVIASLREHMQGNSDVESFLVGGISADAMGAFFRAAAGLYRAKPWKVVPDDGSLLSFTVKALSVSSAVVSVIGQMGESFGFVVFESVDDFYAFCEVMETMERGGAPQLPPHFALNFERGTDLSTSVRKEVASQRWEVAGAAAYPSLVAIDADMIGRTTPTPNELALAECICLALPELLRHKKPLLDAWHTGEPYEKTLTVRAHAGDLEVIVRAPHEDQLELATSDAEARRASDDAIVEHFATSPEGKAREEARNTGLLLVAFANEYFGASITALSARQLRKILFDLVPRKVIADPADAPAMIAELRAFYTFMDREFGLPHAQECLRVFDGDAASKLRAALSDPKNFGPTKSVMVAGRAAGFDMSTQEGVEAWMRELEGKPLPHSISLPWPDARPLTPRTAPRKDKDKRKAARKTRKKNR